MRRGLRVLAAAGLLLLLTECTPTGNTSENSFLSNFGSPNPAPGNFFVCYGYGCKYRTRISLTAEEWRSVRAKFQPPATDAPAERTQAAEAVAQLDRLVGRRTGTLVHQLHSRWNYGDPTQLDCVDNSVNTWTYFTMLAHDGLLRYHRVGGLAHRGTLLTLDFSNTAFLVQKDNGAQFAVDPWMGDAGVPPPVLPLAEWRRTD
ncbi:MAG TPA: hypothetical protein VMU06_06670 [Stellaceae bacterium]|nr:hypothetical protein [Stellaceae bacterium]